ncbi:MAG: hypothetical protein LAT56_00295 [Wenzhouxiangella sp.]|nr:hypothetical protein [Wenzhouxiangella sp.]
MGIGAVAIGVGLVGAGINAYAGYKDRQDQAAKAKRDGAHHQAKLDSNYRHGSTQISLQREALTDARATADKQLSQAESSFARETDALNRQRGMVDREFTRATESLQRSRKRAHEQIHRESTNTMAGAAAGGVRGGSGIDRARQDKAEGKADLDFAVNQERERMGDTHTDVHSQFDDMDAAMEEQMAMIQHQHSMTLNDITRSGKQLDSAYQHLKTTTDADTSLLQNAIGDAQSAADNPWNILGDAFSGFQGGMNISSAMFGDGASFSDLFSSRSSPTKTKFHGGGGGRGAGGLQFTM